MVFIEHSYLQWGKCLKFELLYIEYSFDMNIDINMVSSNIWVIYLNN